MRWETITGLREELNVRRLTFLQVRFGCHVKDGLQARGQGPVRRSLAAILLRDGDDSEGGLAADRERSGQAESWGPADGAECTERSGESKGDAEAQGATY